VWNPARKVLIEDLQKGKYREATDEEPAHIVTPWGEKVTRARVLGTVVDKVVDERMCFLFLDDGTGVISLRAWEEEAENLEKYEIGSLLDVIGRIKEFAGEIYLQPELVMRVKDPNLETLRLLEIVRIRKKAVTEGMPPVPKETPRPKVEIVEMLPPEREIESVIEKLDRGEGVSVEEIALALKISKQEAWEGIRRLLAEGALYEFKEGRYKKVK
jgi:biotin operon repressor